MKILCILPSAVNYQFIQLKKTDIFCVNVIKRKLIFCRTFNVNISNLGYNLTGISLEIFKHINKICF